MKKKLLVLSAIIISVLCALCLSACGRNKKPQTVYDDSGVEYELSYNNTAYTVSDCSADATDVEIRSECNGLPVISIRSNAFRECKNLIGVVIPDSITDIGERAFYNCSSLTRVAIPNGITRVENDTFFGCRGLAEIETPNGITRIGHRAFQYCSGLERVDIPSGVVSIGDGAFQYCWKLNNITIPSSVTSIGSEAFYECFGLTSIEVPNSVTSVGEDAFYGCYHLLEAEMPTNALSSLTIERNLQKLVINGGNASIRSYMFKFSGISHLTNLTISSAVTVIEPNCMPNINTAGIYCHAP